MVSYPQSLHDKDDDKYHAFLTDEGVALLKTSKHRKPKLEPGVHYRVKDTPGDGMIPYPEGAVNDTFRHTWIIQKRNRPVAPMFIGSPVPMKRDDSADRSAMLTMAYFHPWTLRAGDAEGSVVPFAGNLRDREESWQCALSTWLSGNVVSQESVRYINNFMCVYRIRPRDIAEDMLSDEDFSDEELELAEADLAHALETRISGRESKGKKSQR